MRNQSGTSAPLLCVAFAWAACGLDASRIQAQSVVVDNVDTGFSVLSGAWNTGSFPTPNGANYRWILTSGSGTAEVEWRPNLPDSGDYLVETWYVAGTNRATDAPYTIDHAGGSTPIPVNQQQTGSQWVSLGTHTFNAGTGGRVTLGNDAGPSVVIADAVRFTAVTTGPVPEFRAMWVSRFEWPNANLGTVQNTIATIMNLLGTNKFNAVLFQVRGQCDTLYPSPFEPWSPLVSNDGNAPTNWLGFDPLQYAIDQAHLRGLEFHAYINSHTAWQSGSQAPPNYAPGHVYFQHFDATNPAARDWLIHDNLGNPVQFEESNYVWIAPGVPAAQAYVRQQIMYVVENYDVDGVHLDRIRSPGTEYSYDPISQSRRTGTGNPAGLGFEDWTRDQITRFVRDLYAQIAEVKPAVKLSSAPLGLYRSDRYPGYPAGPCGYFYGYSCTYQDAQAWMLAGAHDFICPQIYWADGGGNPDFSEILPDWIANNGGRHVYAGQSNSVGLSALLSQISVTRAQGGQGNTVFSYGSFNSANHWSSYSGPGGPYEQPAPLPEMPWKTNPTQGIILGNVTDAVSGDPLIDVHVTRNGATYTALSSADGLYSFLQVDPGIYTLTFNTPGYPVKQIADVVVGAGDVVRVNTTLGGPVDGDLDGDGDVDPDDLDVLFDCLNGPDVLVPPGGCAPATFDLADVDDDLDVDLADYVEYTALFAP